MHTLRYWAAIAAIFILAACGTPTSSTITNTGEAAVQEAEATADNATGITETTTTGDAVTTGGDKQYPAAPTMSIDENKTYTAIIETTDGTMRAELYAKEAPLTVNNFVFLARDGFYANVKFHRIIKGFMVQTGDPQGTGMGGPGYQFEDEPVSREYLRGTLAMANAGANTNGSQFFIVQEDYPLDKNYTIFGKVTEGLDVLDAIANTPVSPNPANPREVSVPDEDVLIKSVTIEEQ